MKLCFLLPVLIRLNLVTEYTGDPSSGGVKSYYLFDKYFICELNGGVPDHD